MTGLPFAFGNRVWIKDPKPTHPHSVRLVVHETLLQAFIARHRHPIGHEVRYGLAYWNHDGEMIEGKGPFEVAFEDPNDAANFDKWQWAVASGKLDPQALSQFNRSVDAMARGLVSANTAQQATPAQSFAVPLRRDAREAGRFIRSTMKGRAHVDSNVGQAKFRNRKDAERFSRWQQQSRRNGFGRNGLSGGRR